MSTNTITVRFTTAHLSAALLFCPKRDDPRRFMGGGFMGGVLIEAHEDGHTRLVATNSASLAVIRNGSQTNESNDKAKIIMPREWANEIAKLGTAHRPKNVILKIHVDGGPGRGEASVGAGVEVYEFEGLARRTPYYRSAIPDGVALSDSQVASLVDPAQFAPFLKAAKYFTKQVPAIAHIQRGEYAHVILIAETTDFYGVLMPLRVANVRSLFNVPQWVNK